MDECLNLTATVIALRTGARALARRWSREEGFSFIFTREGT